MLNNLETLTYVTRVTGKPIVTIYNDVEGTVYYYLVDSFKPANPSSHIHDNELQGRNIEGLMKSIHGYSHGFNATDDQSILTKVDELPVVKFSWQNFRWVKSY